MNLSWEHIVYIALAVISVLWYLFVFSVLKKGKGKNNFKISSLLQKSPIFANKHHNDNEDLDALLNQVEEQTGDPGLFDEFDKLEDDVIHKSLIKKTNGHFKVIKNEKPPLGEDMEKPG